MEEIQRTVNTLIANTTNVLHQLNFMKKILSVADENERVIEETNYELKRIRRFIETTFLGSSLFPFGTEYVYVWELEGGKYYVGWSENLARRIDEHLSGEGAMWTKKYPPIALLEVVRGGKDVEKEKTLRYMREKGFANVRGGPWCCVEYKIIPAEIQRHLKLTIA